MVEKVGGPGEPGRPNVFKIHEVNQSHQGSAPADRGKGVSLKGLAFHCERRGLCGDEGVSDPMAIGVVG